MGRLDRRIQKLPPEKDGFDGSSLECQIIFDFTFLVDSLRVLHGDAPPAGIENQILNTRKGVNERSMTSMHFDLFFCASTMTKKINP